MRESESERRHRAEHCERSESAMGEGVERESVSERRRQRREHSLALALDVYNGCEQSSSIVCYAKQ